MIVFIVFIFKIKLFGIDVNLLSIPSGTLIKGNRGLSFPLLDRNDGEHTYDRILWCQLRLFGGDQAVDAILGILGSGSWSTVSLEVMLTSSFLVSHCYGKIFGTTDHNLDFSFEISVTRLPKLHGVHDIAFKADELEVG